MRIIIHTYKSQDKTDDTIYLDITNPGYDTSLPNEKAALIIYWLKGYQADVSGSVYDQAFVIDDGDSTLQTDLDLNGFSLKNYDRGYTIDNDTIRLQKDLDLSGYALKNFRPKIIIPGEWKSDENRIGSRTYAKFGNDWRVMAPFPCILDGVSILILDKGGSQNYEKIGFMFRKSYDSYSLSHKVFKSIRNANGLEYQYVEPRLRGRSIKLNLGEMISLNLVRVDDDFYRAPNNTKHALVSLILIDDFSYM